MFRLYFPLAFIAYFALWIVYRGVIKKDLKRNLDTLYIGFVFIGVWVLIYMLFLQQ